MSTDVCFLHPYFRQGQGLDRVHIQDTAFVVDIEAAHGVLRDNTSCALVARQLQQSRSARRSKPHRMPRLPLIARHRHRVLCQGLRHGQQRVGVNQRQISRQDEPTLRIWRGRHSARNAVAHPWICQVRGVFTLHHMTRQTTGMHSRQHMVTYRSTTQQGLEFVLRGTRCPKALAFARREDDNCRQHGHALTQDDSVATGAAAAAFFT